MLPKTCWSHCGGPAISTAEPGAVGGAPRRLRPPLAGCLAVGALWVLAALLFYSVGRPIFTDDLWWHLALGRAYLHQGPWLESDPLLFAAPGAPAPAAWLFDAFCAAVLDLAGFGALRVLHVLLVVAILWAVWRVLRRDGAPPAVAALGTSAFIALAAYRLFQLRPELATILATLALYSLLLASARAPSLRALALGALLAAVWANLHAGFLLGPILLAAALLALVVTYPLQHATRRPAQAQRLRRLALALGLVLVATLANPAGPGAHLAYFAAGESTPDLAVVSDEWSPLALFAAPLINAPPAPLVWGLAWLLLLSVLGIAFRALAGWRAPDADRWVDPALLSLCAAALVASLVAVRFSWLLVFPLLLLARTTRHATRSPRLAYMAAALTLALVPGFWFLGDWPFLSRGVPRDLEGYRTPYPAQKYYAHAAWFLRDAGVEGRLFTNYYQGGFYGLWLAPRVRPFVNGSLNVPQRAVDDYLAIQTGFGLKSRRELLERLDANGIDLFLGVGMPSSQRPNRPWRYTTRHLEGAPGWLTVYRNLNSAVYMRDAPQTAQELERIARYYADRGVPFDVHTGFDAEAVLRAAPSWAIAQGLVPANFRELQTARFAADPQLRLRVRNKLASVYTALGLYRQAIEIDRELASQRNPVPAARRRLVWCLLALGRDEEALAESASLAGHPLSLLIQATAEHLSGLDDPEVRALSQAFLPVFTHPESGHTAAGRVPTPARPFTEP